MFPNELEETDKSYKHNTTSNTGSPTVQNRQYRFNQHLNIKSQKTNQDELDKIQSDNILNQCMNSKLGYTLEPETNLVQVILKRKSPDCPWGITISGTDDAPDIPVLIDSVNPNDPGGECGLIQPGDRILAINGITLHNGHTLTQAMRMLQHFPDKVILHIARKSNFSSSANNPSIIPASSSSGGVGVMHSEQVTGKVLTEVFNKQREQVDQPSVHRKCTLKKAVASSNFMSNNFSDGQPLTGRTPVYRHKTNSSNIRLCNPEHYDDTKQALQKSRTLYDARSGAQVMDMSWPGSGNHPERNISKESNISNRLASKSSTTVPNMTSENFGIQGDTYNEGIPVENLNLKVPSNHPRSQTSKSHHRCSSSSSKRFTQPTPPQEQQPPLQPPCSVKYQITEGERSKYSQAYIHQYSDITTSEINDDADQGHNNETTNYPSHNFPPRHPDQQIPHYYPNKKHTKSSTDHLEMDLNFIECSGCRKAIEKEIKYYLSKQQKSYEGTYRASSSHRKDQSTIRSTSEAFLTSNYFELDFDHLQTHQPHPQQHYPPGNANRPPVWYLSKNDNQIPVSLIHEPSTFHYDKQQNQYQQQHSKNTEENTRVNQKKMTSSHMLSDHHSKSDSRLDLIRSIDLSDESSDIEKRNSLSVTYSTRMSAGSSQMHPPQNTYNCQSSVINPVKQKTISRIKSNTLGSPMNIQTNSSQFPKHIQRTHPKTSKSNKKLCFKKSEA
ncbi:unnamed protein product [Heterobilharzia americana]|nr:unnamed protein product [Heterobilharzia americana]